MVATALGHQEWCGCDSCILARLEEWREIQALKAKEVERQEALAAKPKQSKLTSKGTHLGHLDAAQQARREFKNKRRLANLAKRAEQSRQRRKGK